MDIKIIAVAGLAAVCLTPAAASYELLLVADEPAGVVHRFDGTSGRALGEFGRGRTSIPVGIAADASRGLAYVASFGTETIQTWNYSTGILVNEWRTPSVSPRGLARAANGDLLVATSGGIRRYTTNGALVRSYGVGIYTGVTQAADGAVWGFNSSNGQMQRFSFDGGALLNSFTPAASGSIFSYYSLTPNGNGVMTTRSTTVYGWTTTDGSGAADVVFGLTDALAFGRGHSNVGYVVSGASGSRGIVPVNTLTGLRGPAFGTGIINTPTGMAVVVAPEPGTMAAIGLGLAGLIARRRRRG